MPSLDNMMLRQIIMDHYENPRNHELVEDDSYKKVNMLSSWWMMLSDVFWNRNINWDYLMIRSDTVMKKGNVQ